MKEGVTMAKRKSSQPVQMKKVVNPLSFIVQTPKGRDIFMQALIARKGAGAGAHRAKASRGDGRGKGKAARHLKHKGRRDW